MVKFIAKTNTLLAECLKARYIIWIEIWLSQLNISNVMDTIS